MLEKPSQARLDEALVGATGFRLLDGGTNDPRPVSDRLIFSSQGPKDVTALRAALRVRDGESYCMCGSNGDATLCIDAPQADTKFGIHHGNAIQWDDHWKMHAAIEAPQALADFFAARGWARYRDALQVAASRADERESAHARWLAAMPASLRTIEAELFDHANGGTRAGQLDRARRLVVEAHRSDEATVRALLYWYGSGRGEWSGFPSYESLASELLLTFPTAVVIHAIEGDLDEAASAGAARHCAGWHFRRERKRLPNSVVAKLRAWIDVHGADEHREAFGAVFREGGKRKTP